MHGTLPISDDQALASLRDVPDAPVSIAALSRDWGWTRHKVRRKLDRWRRDGDLPPASKRQGSRRRRPAAKSALVPAAIAVEPDAAPVSTIAPTTAPPSPRSAAPARGVGRYLGAGVLAAIGVALASVGMVETTAYAANVGGFLFAALAVCADGLVLVMPSAVTALWRRRPPIAFLAAMLWLVAAIVTVANLSGYVGQADDQFRGGRETRSTERALAMERLARLRHERAAIAELRPAGALQVAVRSARRNDKPALREALAVAQRRDTVEVELSAAASALPAMPEIATADPSAGVLSEITGETIREIDLRRLRLALLLLLPLCGGFVLSVGLALISRRSLAGDLSA